MTAWERRRRWSAAIGLAAVLIGACGAGDDTAPSGPEDAIVPDSSGTRVAPTSASIPVVIDLPGSAPPDLDPSLLDYCEQARSLAGERPERYVGSAEHIADIEALRAVAPTDVASQLDTFVDFLRSGAISPDDPDSNLVERFPADVQAAIATFMSFTEANC